MGLVVLSVILLASCGQIRLPIPGGLQAVPVDIALAWQTGALRVDGAPGRPTLSAWALGSVAMAAPFQALATLLNHTCERLKFMPIVIGPVSSDQCRRISVVRAVLLEQGCEVVGFEQG